jgi:hypothetical protein
MNDYDEETKVRAGLIEAVLAQIPKSWKLADLTLERSRFRNGRGPIVELILSPEGKPSRRDGSAVLEHARQFDSFLQLTGVNSSRVTLRMTGQGYNSWECDLIYEKETYRTQHSNREGR